MPAMEMADIASSMDFGIVIQLFVICMALALVASAASVITIMRYDPLHILSNRD